MRPGRVAHCLRTAGLAQLLAPTWLVDPDKARLAGLLHDWGRGLSAAELLAEAARRHLPISAAARLRPVALLHAPVGAALLAEKGMEDLEILRAVALHTVGAAGMSRLEALVFVADYAEPGRTHPQATIVRRLARTDPAEAVRQATAATLRFLIESGEPVEGAMLDLWNDLRIRALEEGGQ